MISIVDDDPSFRDATRRLVKSLGYGADTFASAEDFLQSDRVNDTSCLILDVNMPGLSGIELQSHLTAQGNRTPIIFITAAPEETIRAKALKAGAIGFLSKPFKEECLIDHLDAALKSRNEEDSQAVWPLSMANSLGFQRDLRLTEQPSFHLSQRMRQSPVPSRRRRAGTGAAGVRCIDAGPAYTKV